MIINLHRFTSTQKDHHFLLALFGQVYLLNSKRWRKSVNILPEALSAINLKIKLHQNWMKNKNYLYLSNTRNFGILAHFRPLLKTKVPKKCS